MSKKKEVNQSSSKENDDPSLDMLVEAVLENFEESIQAGDPFEFYVQSVRAHIQGDRSAYKARVAKGYKILIQELSQKNKDPS